MELQILKKFEGKQVRLFLKNNFIYSYVNFEITEDNLLKFIDKHGEELTIEPSFVSCVTEINAGVDNGN